MVPSEISNFRLRPFEMFSLHFLFLPKDLSFSFFFVFFVFKGNFLDFYFILLQLALSVAWPYFIILQIIFLFAFGSLSQFWLL